MMLYGWALSGILALAMLGMNLWKDKQIDAQAAAYDTTIEGLRTTNSDMKAAAVFKELALVNCNATNEANTVAREEVQAQGAEAVFRQAIAKAAADDKIKLLYTELEEARKNVPPEYYRLDDEYPTSFTDRLRKPTDL